jgi:hydroxymethylbilane synthase
METARTLRLATRGSPLSLAQSEEVASMLSQDSPYLVFQFVRVTTHGDRHAEVPLLQLPGPDGVFTRGLEAELLAGRADLAVHSLKDLPTGAEQELVVAAFPPRADPRDALVSRWPGGFDQLPRGAVVGTSSPRRAAQVLGERPDLHVIPLRGNVDTRLHKLQAGQVDALLLAAAGLERLGRCGEISEYLSVERFTPAVGQGALAVQCRAEDLPRRELLEPIDHAPTRAAVTAERAFLSAMGGGCRLPLAGYAEVDLNRLSLRGFVATPDGAPPRIGSMEGPADDPEALGVQLAGQLLSKIDSSLPAGAHGG